MPRIMFSVIAMGRIKFFGGRFPQDYMNGTFAIDISDAHVWNPEVHGANKKKEKASISPPIPKRHKTKVRTGLFYSAR